MKSPMSWRGALLSLALACVALTAPPADAATRRAVPGGMFAACEVGGEFAAPAGGAIVTHAGLVPLPIGEPTVLFTDTTTVTGFRIAVKSHTTDRALVWNGAAWSDTGKVSHGTQGHVWTDAGELFVHEPCADCDSQGIRWWEPGVGPIYGSDTYNPFTVFARAKNVTLLYEWTCRGDVCVGQGEEGDTVVQYRGRHFALERGDSRFNKFERAGDALCVATTKFREREAVIHWLSVGEIEGLAAYVPPAPAPPTPEPTPAPSPQPTLPDPDSVRAALERERAKFGTPMTNDQMAVLLNAVALQFPGMGMHRKPSGETAATLPNGVSVNRNVLRYLPPGDNFGYWSDVLVAAGVGQATPVAPHWERSTDDDASFVKPIATGTSAPPPPPPPTGVTRAEMDAAIGAAIRPLLVRIDRLESELSALTETVGSIQFPAPGASEQRVREMIAEAFARAVVQGKTERDRLGLQHEIRLGVVIR